MRKLICCFSLLFLSACTNGKTAIQIANVRLQYYQYRPSLSGKFFFTLNDMANIYKRHLPVISHLVSTDSSGKLLFQRQFEHRQRIAGVVDFRPIEPGVLSYFMAGQTGINSHAQLFFIDRNWNDLWLRTLPNNDPDFDLHDILRTENGNYFLIFYHNRAKEGVIDYEIQEWTPEGKVVYSWNSKSLKVPAGTKASVDPFHLNALSFSPDHKLVVSLCDTSGVIKIDYPGTNVLWRMSYRDWKFIGDSWNGFRYQHTVRSLENGNLLIFDNGDGNKNISRAVEYRIDEKNKTAHLVWEYRNTNPKHFRDIQGSVQRLSNGNTLIGWGSPPENVVTPDEMLPLFTEVNSAGEKVREMMSPGHNISYRVYFEENR
jgi:hypothetical protein